MQPWGGGGGIHSEPERESRREAWNFYFRPEGFAEVGEVESCLFLASAMVRAVGNSVQNFPKERLCPQESSRSSQCDPKFRVLEWPTGTS